MLKSISLLVFISFYWFLSAQQVGNWRLHFRYATSNALAYSENNIMTANDNSVLLYNYKEKGAQGQDLQKELDKANALSDIGISDIAFCKAQNTFVIAYNSTNIDLISNDLVLTNMPDIKNKVTAGSKNINNIYINGSMAYLATDLGIIVLDIENQEIDNTYIIGNGGNPEPILDCTIYNDTIYALSKTEGIKKAALTGVNLLDFNSWVLDNSVPGGSPSQIEVFNNNLYLIIDKNLYQKTGATWQSIYQNTNSNFVSLTASEKLTAVFTQDSAGTNLKRRILTIDQNATIDTIIDYKGLRIQEAIYTSENDLYMADASLGLRNFSTNKTIEPNGKPFKNEVYSFSSYKNKVFAAPGSISDNLDAGYNYDGFYYFENNDWKNINRYSFPELDPIINFLDVKQSKFDQKIYGATTTGLVVYDYDNFTLYDTANSKIKAHFDGGSSRYITSLDFDLQGNIWMVNSQTIFPLLVLTRQGNWHAYPLSFGANLKYNKIMVDQNSQKWVSLKGKGISVFPSIEDFEGNHDNASISLTIGTANLPNDNVNCITEDHSGNVWVGTDEGVAVFYCPNKIFDNTTDCKLAERIKSTLDQYTEYLFSTDKVNAITVDGANRKWVGTNSGAYLISESGADVLQVFNTENSPLPSNEVLTIGIQTESGEVLIGTNLGMASYYGDATNPADDISNIKAFPNPVRPDYNGVISVTGLVENSFIKITDIHGTLIKEGEALGGKFVWDGKSYNGKRARTGVYLVFSSDNKSKNKAVAKIVFIN